MRLVYTERILNRLQQLVNEISQASDLDYHDRLRAFKQFCDEIPALHHCLAQLPQVPYDFAWLNKSDRWPAGEEGYAMRWDAINKVVDPGPSGLSLVRSQGAMDYKVALPRFTQLFVIPIYDYLVDRLESSSTMLYILLRHKRWAEWFEAERLRDLYNAEGETGLDCDLRRFLFESGIEYPFSQPESPRGRVDIVAGLETDDPLVLEVKVWDSSKSYRENRCCDGLRQVMDYAAKYGKDKGYVVVFNFDTKPLVFVSPVNTDEWPPRTEHGNRTYYFIAVDIAEQPEPVSQRDKGKPVETNQVRLSDLVAQVTHSESTTSLSQSANSTDPCSKEPQ
jgi:hypothetical protein